MGEATAEFSKKIDELQQLNEEQRERAEQAVKDVVEKMEANERQFKSNKTDAMSRAEELQRQLSEYEGREAEMIEEVRRRAYGISTSSLLLTTLSIYRRSWRKPTT